MHEQQQPRGYIRKANINQTMGTQFVAQSSPQGLKQVLKRLKRLLGRQQNGLLIQQTKQDGQILIGLQRLEQSLATWRRIVVIVVIVAKAVTRTNAAAIYGDDYFVDGVERGFFHVDVHVLQKRQNSRYHTLTVEQTQKYVF